MSASSWKDQTIWVGGNSNDIHYRYKIPAVKLKNQERGAYCKTVLTNYPNVIKKFEEFYKKADRKLMFKFITKQLNSGGKEKGGQYVLNGEYTPKQVNEALCKYFDLFVCCPACSNPETTLCTNKRNKVVYITCLSCGFQGKLSRDAINSEFFKVVLKNTEVDEKKYKNIKKILNLQKTKEEGSSRGKKEKKVKESKSAGGAGDARDPNDMSPVEALEAFLRAKPEPSSLDIIEHIKLLALSRKLDHGARWAMFFNGIFVTRKIQDLLDNIRKYAAVVRYWTHDDPMSAHASYFLGHLTWLAAQRPKSMPAVFATAIATGACTADHVITWQKMPQFKVIPQWRGGGKYAVWEPEPEDIQDLAKNCAPLVEYLEDGWTPHQDKKE